MAGNVSGAQDKLAFYIFLAGHVYKSDSDGFMVMVQNGFGTGFCLERTHSQMIRLFYKK
jgi:hypothetical protein